ncbi:MAG: HPr family phosphocarrier protein [Pseudodesulfovibrio sp.]|nr:HPr family phosphocarrier protein [Pseudodesulfovibrio sp.]
MTEENGTMDLESEGCLSRQVVVANEHGLHARPAGKVAQQAQCFKSSISLVHQDQEVDAKSILDILTLAAGPGNIVEIRATGSDAEAAVESLERLFASRFEEG